MKRYRVMAPEHRGDFSYGIADMHTGAWLAYSNNEHDAEHIARLLNEEEDRH